MHKGIDVTFRRACSSAGAYSIEMGQKIPNIQGFFRGTVHCAVVGENECRKKGEIDKNAPYFLNFNLRQKK